MKLWVGAVLLAVGLACEFGYPWIRHGTRWAGDHADWLLSRRSRQRRLTSALSAPDSLWPLSVAAVPVSVREGVTENRYRFDLGAQAARELACTLEEIRGLPEVEPWRRWCS